MFDKFDFDLDSERLKKFIKDPILNFLLVLVLVLFCLMGFWFFIILKQKEQSNKIII